MTRWLVALLLFANVALATDYHVAVTGDDGTGDGLSLGTAWRTIEHALGTATGGASPDTVYIHAGIYNEAISTELSEGGYAIVGGTAENERLVISGYPGDTVILMPSQAATGAPRVVHLNRSVSSYITITGLVLDASLVGDLNDPNFPGNNVVKIASTATPTNASHHILLTGNEIRNATNSNCVLIVGDVGTGIYSVSNQLIGNHIHHCGTTDSNLEHAVYVSSDTNAISGNVVHDIPGGSGIIVYSGGGGIDDNTVTGNLIYNITTAATGNGIVIGTGEDNAATGNFIWNTTDQAVNIYSESNDLGDPNDHPCDEGECDAVNTVVTNNCYWDTLSGVVETGPGTPSGSTTTPNASASCATVLGGSE